MAPSSTINASTPPSRKGLWVEVRDSESGQRTLAVYDAPIPNGRTDRERSLNRSVPRLFPGATLRAYAGGTAKFVRGSLLIAAHYGAVRHDTELLPLEEIPAPVLDYAGQGTLFPV
jgi:hypothetical protein